MQVSNVCTAKFSSQQIKASSNKEVKHFQNPKVDSVSFNGDPKPPVCLKCTVFGIFGLIGGVIGSGALWMGIVDKNDTTIICGTLGSFLVGIITLLTRRHY